jgi:hypothetical protein
MRPTPLHTLASSLRRAIPPEARRGLWMRGAIVLSVALLIGLLNWSGMNKGQALDVSLVYAYAISTCIWTLTDLLRFPLRHWLRSTSPHYWPDGWRAIAWTAFGVGMGYLIGTAIGDTYAGHSTWDLIHLDRRRFVAILASSLAISAGFLFYFQLRGKNESLQRQASEAKLRLLESQLEPHMLFNTLANLRALIGTDPQRATDMLDRLNDFLRATLQASRSDAQGSSHTLAAEFARLNDYLAIMALRMGPRLSYTLDLPANLANHPVPALLLQPLVENSVRHGLEPSVRGGSIHLCASESQGILCLTVRDDGAGFVVGSGSGFGLQQVQERLSTAFGRSGQLLVSSEPGQGTTAIVRLPMA